MNDSHASTDSRVKRAKAYRIIGAGAALAVALMMAICTHDYIRSQAIKKRLTAVWTDDVLLANGSVETWVWEFRPDGTVRNYPKGKPFPDNGQQDDFMHWEISGGELVLSWDHHFTPGANTKQWFRQFVRLIKERANNKRTPLAYSDRCIIHDAGGDVISFTLHPDEREAESYVPRHFSLTRARADR